MDSHIIISAEMGSIITQSAGIAGVALLSEDAAVIGSAVLAATGALPWVWAFTAAFIGVWLGDLLLYAIGRWLGAQARRTAWLQRWIPAGQWERSEAWFARHSVWALAVSRVVPGTRLATYTVAGALKVPAGTFAGITAAFAAGWIGIVFVATFLVGHVAVWAWIAALQSSFYAASGFVLAGIIGVALAVYALRRAWPRLVQWEFWPAWVFYVPVAANYLRLGVKYRGFCLPTCANPGMATGGMIGESKSLTLRQLQEQNPEFTAATGLIPAGNATLRVTTLLQQITDLGLSFPLVLKPDVAQRGSGFKVARSPYEAMAYLERVESAIVVQEYVPGPMEAGIFYYRMPGEAAGRIFAITDKIFPVVIGDGCRTIEDLILGDPRAAMMSGVYLQRLAERRLDILVPGETLRLVEAGNHAQGCIFRDGMHLWSEQLEARIDAVSRSIPEFYIGRYDVRYESEADLKAGRNFRILELNGAAAEATSIYDARRSLWGAYATLFEQWELVFAIGARNRERGCRPDTAFALCREWLSYQGKCAQYPLAD
ncbi:MAG: VTT domain-containing protein [Candidatus Methylacidiphilales bacterium]